MEKKIIKKLLALLLVIAIISTDFFVLGSSLITYAATQIETATQEGNIEFSVYFKDESNNKLSSIEKVLNAEELRVYALVKVKEEGYFNGTLEIKNSNFNLSREILSTEIASIKGNEVKLKQINAGETVEIELGIQPILTETMPADMLLQTTVALSGKYISSENEEGVEITPAERTVGVKYTVEDSAEAELVAEIITNDLFTLAEGNRRIVQLLVKSKITDNKYPIEKTNLIVSVPKLGETAPESVEVLTINESLKLESYELIDENANLQIVLVNKSNDNQQISWNRNGYDETVVTFIYPETVDASVVETTVNSQVKVYNLDEALSTEPVDADTKTQLNNVVMVKSEITSTELYKGKLYAKEASTYNTETSMVVTKAGLVDGVTINETPDAFITNGDDVTAITEYISTRISKKQIIDTLGQNGTITIKCGDKPIYEIKNISEIESETIEINYEEHKELEDEIIDKLTIITSKPEKEGIIQIKHTKAITGTYTRDQIKSITALQTTSSITATNITATASAEVEMKETISRADLVVVSDGKLSTTEVNDLDLGIIFVTDGPQYDLLNDSTITIQMPSAVESVGFNTPPTIQNVNNDTIEITDYGYNSDTNQITIVVEGEQTSYPGAAISELYIPLDLTVKLLRLAPSEESKIEMTYTNGNASKYYGNTEEAGVSSQETEIQAPTGLVKYFNLNINSNTTINETISQKLVSENAGKEVEFEVTIMNNTGADINNAKILGKLPTTGIDNNTIETKLNSITANGATVYYTENAGATDDLESETNGWTQNYTNTAKKYLIKLDELSKGANYTATVKVQIPNQITDGLNAYTQYEVIYESEGITKTELSREILLQMVSDFEVKLTAQAGETILSNGAVVKEGEVVKYITTVKNNTNKIAENVQFKANIPQGTVVVEPREDYEYYNEDPFYYIERTDLNEMNITIPSLAVGEIYTHIYEVRVDMNAVKSVTEIANKATVTHGDFKLETDTIKNKLEESDIRVTIKRTDDRGEQLHAGHMANYNLYVENFLNETVQNVELQLVTDTFEIIKFYDTEYINQIVDKENKITIESILGNSNKMFRIYGKIKPDIENSNVFARVIKDGKTQRSNIITENLPKIEAEIGLTSSHNNEIIQPNEKVTYEITVKNTGKEVEGNSFIKMEFPEYLEIESIGIDGKTDLQITEKSNKETYIEKISNNLTYTFIEPIVENAIHKIKIVAKVKDIPLELDGEKIGVKADLMLLGVNEGTSQEIIHTLDCGQKSVITGSVWIEEDVNGKKDETESTLLGVTVKVYDTTTHTYLTDKDGKIVEVDTNDYGIYTLTNIPNGSYIIVFEHGMKKYESTMISENVAKTQTILLNGEEITVDGYEISNLQDQIIYDINLGLKDKSIQIPDNPDDPDDGDEPKEEYKTITGYAWLDLDRDGERDDKDNAIEGVKVFVYDTSTKDYLKDSNGAIITKTTDSTGKYQFDNLKKGSYILVFEYDSEEYEPTTYLAEGIDVTKNSQAVLKKININGEEKLLTVTDTINLQDNIDNINIGLKEKIKFDLELNKYIRRIVVQNNKETKAYDYNNEQFAKVEIHRKQINGSLVVIEYVIKVKNAGEAAGYVKNIVDYLPNGLTFSSELNTDWYLSGNNLYTKSLENIELQPGEEREIKLILTKTMTAENTGLVNNRAEIYEDYNKYGAADIDSTPNNQIQDEDDMSSADVIILVATGGGNLIGYMTLIIINMILIGIAIKLMIQNNIITIPSKRGRR